MTHYNEQREEGNAQPIQNDTLTILLSNRIHRGLDNKARAIKLSKTCKFIRDKTKDKILYNACRNVIKAVQAGNYKMAIDAINLTERNHYEAYGA